MVVCLCGALGERAYSPRSGNFGKATWLGRWGRWHDWSSGESKGTPASLFVGWFTVRSVGLGKLALELRTGEYFPKGAHLYSTLDYGFSSVQYRERVFLKSLLRAYVLGAWVAVLATFQPYIQGSEVVYKRFAAQGFDPNDLSFYLNLAIPFAAYFGFRATGLVAKIIYLTYIPSALFTVFLTASRAGTLGAAVALLFTLYSLRTVKWKWRLAYALLLGVGIGIAVTQVPPESFARITTLGLEMRALLTSELPFGWQVSRYLLNILFWV